LASLATVFLSRRMTLELLAAVAEDTVMFFALFMVKLLWPLYQSRRDFGLENEPRIVRPR